MHASRLALAAGLTDKIQSGADAATLSREIAAYLLSEGRVGELDSLMRDIQAARAERGVVEVLAASAHQLDPEVKNDIEAMVHNVFPDAKKVIVTEVIDPEVIGGVRLSFAHQQLDLSVKAKLNKFKQLTSAGKE